MRNAITLLIIVAFIAAFPAHKVIASAQGTDAPLCFHKGITLSYANKEFHTPGKGHSSALYFLGYEKIEDNGLCKEENNTKERLVLFSTLTVHHSASSMAASTLYCNKQYASPYNTLIQLPFYILNHALIIPYA